ncbi:hypothetical protein [Streptomyces mirabilis]
MQRRLDRAPAISYTLPRTAAVKLYLLNDTEALSAPLHRHR